MTLQSEFILNNSSSAIKIETIQIWHSSFLNDDVNSTPHDFWLCANFENLVATSFPYLDIPIHWQSLPMKISFSSDSEDLDQAIKIEIHELGQIFCEQLLRICADNKQANKPEIYYRAKRSDNLNENMIGPLYYKVSKVSCKSDGVIIEANSRLLNNSRTGSTYNVTDYPMLNSVI